ncbi:MAG: DUF58 domain-containing protein [Phycisphaerales bacterium]
MPRSNASTRPPSSRHTVVTMAGLLHGLTTLFLAIGAINGQNNLLFWAFGLGLGGILVSGIFSGSGMMGLRLGRHTPRTARAGEPMQFRYEVRNANRLMPMFGLGIAEVTKGASPLARAPMAFVHNAPARRSSTVAAPATPNRRGVISIKSVSVASSFPLGLMRKVMVFDLPATITVLPARVRLRDDLVPRPARRGHGGAATATAVGPSDEFFGVREYVPGDSPRLVAWRPSARSDTLIVRQQGAPPPTIVWVCLDLPESAEELQRERAIALAAAMIELLAQRGASVGLIVRPGEATRLPAPGAWHARRLLHMLAVWGTDEQPAAKDAAAKSGKPASGAGRGFDHARIRPDHAVVVVHATRERSPSVPWASHMFADDIASYLAPGDRIPDILLPPAPPESRRDRWRRVAREFFMVDPVGEVVSEAGDAGEPKQDASGSSERAARRPVPLNPGRSAPSRRREGAAP